MTNSESHGITVAGSRKPQLSKLLLTAKLLCLPNYQFENASQKGIQMMF